MNRESTKPLASEAGEAWIDGIESGLRAQTALVVGSLRWWRRLSLGLVSTQAEVAGSAAGATTAAVEGGAKAAASVSEAAAASTSSISRTLAEQARRQRKQAEATIALDALTVEQLDRLAGMNNVDEYPKSAVKREKVEALAAAGLSLDSLSIDHLDRVAATHNLEDYPQSGNKSEKIAALETAAISVN